MWFRLMFILTLVNIMTCVGAWYAVSSSYGDLKTFIVMVPYKNYIEISRSVLLRRVCYALGGLMYLPGANRFVAP